MPTCSTFRFRVQLRGRRPDRPRPDALVGTGGQLRLHGCERPISATSSSCSTPRIRRRSSLSTRAGAIKFDSPNQLGVPTHGGQPQEAAAWVAYANADASIYGTANDIALGVDAEGNNWKTAGYWAKLRASTPAEYSTWAAADGVYDSRNAFLAIDRDAPVGIKYWEIGNESVRHQYGGHTTARRPNFGDRAYTGYALNYAVPYDGTARDDNPALIARRLRPAGQRLPGGDEGRRSEHQDRGVLATPRTTASDLRQSHGDYSWSYADVNDNGVKQSNEPYWNDEVLSHTDAGLGKVADNVDFVIAHWYPGGTSTTILNQPRTTIPVMINGTTAGLDTGTNAGLRDSIAAWRSDGDAQRRSRFSLPRPTATAVRTQTSDGLFAADEYATFFENGVSNVDWLELHNGSFLAETPTTPNFAYWGIQSVHLLAEAGDELVSTTTTESDVRIHAPTAGRRHGRGDGA